MKGKQSIWHIRAKAKKIWLVVSLLILLSIICLVLLLVNKKDDQALLTSPNYETILPSGKTIAQLGGWQRVSPLDDEPVFAYSDAIGKVPISVSQQPLPESLKENSTEQIAKLAKSYNATNKLVAGDTDFYLGISVKGPQSVILAKNNLLILIKSQEKIKDEAWIAYIESLNGLSY